MLISEVIFIKFRFLLKCFRQTIKNIYTLLVNFDISRRLENIIKKIQFFDAINKLNDQLIDMTFCTLVFVFS